MLPYGIPEILKNAIEISKHGDTSALWDNQNYQKQDDIDNKDYVARFHIRNEDGKSLATITLLHNRLKNTVDLFTKICIKPFNGLYHYSEILSLKEGTESIFGDAEYVNTDLVPELKDFIAGFAAFVEV